MKVQPVKTSMSQQKEKRGRRRLKNEVKMVLALLISIWIGLPFLNNSYAEEKPKEKRFSEEIEHSRFPN